MEFAELYFGFLTYTATRWYFVTACIALAICFYFLDKSIVVRTKKGIFNYLFPQSIYLHQSTKTDLKYLLVLPIVSLLVFLPAISLFYAAVSEIRVLTELSLAFFLGEIEQTQELTGTAGILGLILFTIVFAMVADLGFYLHHLAFHKIPFLWEFHKVHHSAEVLTPLTDYRAHPLEMLTVGIATGIMLGLAQGIFVYITASTPSVVTLTGMNLVFFLYYLSGYSLRHSHFWIYYGPVFSKVLISPAQHQIHHSSAVKHWDKNFGGTFALWDWLFGTLYLPESKEEN